jgi:hypothetical protein
MILLAYPLAGVLALAATSALAQDTDTIVTMPDTLIGFLVQMLFLIISGIIAVFLPILLTKLAARFNLEIEHEKRDALQTTFTNAAGGLLQKLGEDARTLRIDVKNPDLAAAVNRALKGAPDALKWAGLSEAEIARRILEKIPQVPSPAPTPIATPAVSSISGRAL